MAAEQLDDPDDGSPRFDDEAEALQLLAFTTCVDKMFDVEASIAPTAITVIPRELNFRILSSWKWSIKIWCKTIENNDTLQRGMEKKANVLYY